MLPGCSTEHTYYTMSCNGPHVPQEYLFKAPDQKVATLVTNNYLSNLLAQKHLPKISNFDVDIASGRFKVQGDTGGRGPGLGCLRCSFVLLSCPTESAKLPLALAESGSMT